MKRKDLIQSIKNKRPSFFNGIKSVSSLEFLYIADKNVIIDKNNKVVKWCDARRSKLYMFWQRIKYKIFGKL